MKGEGEEIGIRRPLTRRIPPGMILVVCGSSSVPACCSLS